MSRVPAQFVGLSPTQLRAWLTSVQQAIQDLTIGGKPEATAYTQGDGSKSATFTKADLGALNERANALAAALSGGGAYRRRPIRPLYL